VELAPSSQGNLTEQENLADCGELHLLMKNFISLKNYFQSRDRELNCLFCDINSIFDLSKDFIDKYCIRYIDAYL